MRPRKALLATILAFVAVQAIGAGAAMSQTELEAKKRYIMRCNSDGSIDCQLGCDPGYTCC